MQLALCVGGLLHDKGLCTDEARDVWGSRLAFPWPRSVVPEHPEVDVATRHLWTHLPNANRPWIRAVNVALLPLQNIDSLEHQAGLPTEAVVAAHGNFDTARCIKVRSSLQRMPAWHDWLGGTHTHAVMHRRMHVMHRDTEHTARHGTPVQCGMPHDVDYVREAVFQQEGNPCYCKKRVSAHCIEPRTPPADQIMQTHAGWRAGVQMRCACAKLHDDIWQLGPPGQLAAGRRQPCLPNACSPQSCGGLVKPDIVFFGESLPERFWER